METPKLRWIITPSGEVTGAPSGVHSVRGPVGSRCGRGCPAGLFGTITVRPDRSASGVPNPVAPVFSSLVPGSGGASAEVGGAAVSVSSPLRRFGTTNAIAPTMTRTRTAAAAIRVRVRVTMPLPGWCSR